MEQILISQIHVITSPTQNKNPTKQSRKFKNHQENYAMKALNAVTFTPISALSEPKRTELRRISCSLPSKPSKSFHGGLVLISSVFSAGISKALTYEEALQQSLTSNPNDIPFDFGGFMDGVINFGSENPVLIAGAAAVVAVPLLVSQLTGKSKPFGVESAKNAYAKLSEDENVELVDIRETVDIRKMGSPDIRALKKKTVAIVYNGEDKLGFLKKLALKFKEPENTTLIILDKFDGSSELVAELVTSNGFKAAYAVKDGAEGPRGWMSSGLPWIAPKKSFSFDLSSFTESLGEGSEAISVALGVVAAAGLGLFAFTEVETILQVLGSAALIQFISKKLLVAEARKETLQQADEFLSTKIAPKDFVDEIKQIGLALLPSPTSKILPAPAVSEPDASPTVVQAAEAVLESPNVQAAVVEPPSVQAAEAVVESSNVQVAEPVPETPNVQAAEAVQESTNVQEVEAPTLNSTPTAEVKKDPVPSFSRPLSPYPQYPDFKPPTSPTPSPP